MRVEGVAIIPSCAKCEAHWLPKSAGGPHLTDEPAELVFYCPD